MRKNGSFDWRFAWTLQILNRTISQLVTGGFSDVKIATIPIPIGTSNLNVKA